MTDRNGTELAVGQRVQCVEHHDSRYIGRKVWLADIAPVSPHGRAVKVHDGPTHDYEITPDGDWSWAAWLKPEQVVVIGEVQDE